MEVEGKFISKIVYNKCTVLYMNKEIDKEMKIRVFDYLNEEFFNFREDFKKVWIPKLQGKIIDYLPTLEETSYYNIESHLKQYLENINESFLNLFLDKQFKTISKKADKDVYFAESSRQNKQGMFFSLSENFFLVSSEENII